MADKAELLQAIDDAILDADSLERFINGADSETVLTRLSAEYPTLQKALKELFENGGIAGRFKTLTELQTSDLADGSYALVADDAVDKNGIYIKEGGEWIKSKYDLKSLIDSMSRHNNDSNLIEYKDLNETTFAYFDKKAHLFLAGMVNSVQDEVGSITNAIELDSGIGLASVLTDTNGEIIQATDTFGVLYVSDIFTNKGSITQQIDNVLTENQETQKVGLNKRVVLADADEFTGIKGLFSPILIRTGVNEYFLVFEARSDGGDFEGTIRIVGRQLTYNPSTKEITSGSIKNIVDNGTKPDGTKYNVINACATYIRSGTNNGRILILYNTLDDTPDASQDYTNQVTQVYSTYSDDGGSTFSEPALFTHSEPEFESYIFCPAHGLQLSNGDNKNRLVTVIYGRRNDATNARAIYSNDGGDSWSSGGIIPLAGINECQLTETDEGHIVCFARRGGNAEKYRSVSKDGGATFSMPQVVDNLKGAGTKVGIASCGNPYDYSINKFVAVLGRDGDASSAGRNTPHVFISYDDGYSFSQIKKLGDGICQYSDVVPLPNSDVLVAYGGGKTTSFVGGQIIGHILDVEFLTGEK